jgi:plasmid stabilization system protein ParE
LRIKWTALAARQFKDNQRYYGSIDRQAARLLAMRVKSALRRLSALPDMGRPGVHPGTREWVVQRSPYIIIYRIERDVLQILHLWHGRQRRAVVD